MLHCDVSLAKPFSFPKQSVQSNLKLFLHSLMIVKATYTTEGNYFCKLIADFVCLVCWTSVHTCNSNLAFYAHVLQCN